MQGRKNYTEKLFLSFQLSDRIPKDNLYRRLRSLERDKNYSGHPTPTGVVFHPGILPLENMERKNR
ncbi:hypothetical protein [Ulvibacterium sp.]|uniref:hypothetical protein n=1 Tax=Ulvibacterium sp. TaxID=2665914 RepID=UPI003BA96837